jgi:hypothetical protein
VAGTNLKDRPVVFVTKQSDARYFAHGFAAFGDVAGIDGGDMNFRSGVGRNVNNQCEPSLFAFSSHCNSAIGRVMPGLNHLRFVHNHRVEDDAFETGC